VLRIECENKGPLRRLSITGRIALACRGGGRAHDIYALNTLMRVAFEHFEVVDREV